MDKKDQKYYEKIITLTAYPEWDDYVKDLESEIYAIQCDAFEAKDWDEFNIAKGMAQGLARIVNLRADTKQILEMETDEL